jgi:basic amino acid/polyamine antiporter, APA family
MVEYTAPVFWFFLLLVGIALLRLRVKDPHRKRPFAVPFYPLLPLVFCGVCGFMLYSSVLYTGIGAMVGIGVLAAGLPFLLLWRRSSPITDNHIMETE